jgi:DNA-binding CsgD family transcriptional regulator
MARGGNSTARAELSVPTRAPLRPVRDAASENGRRRFRNRSARLSGKERVVFAELARGNTTEEIAEILVLSPHTVRTHVKNGMRKLGAKTRAHAVAIALSEGTIALEG